MQNDVLGQIKAPAIGLIILGSINGLSGLVTLLSGVLRLTGFTGDKLPTDEAERLGFLIGTGFFYGVGFFSMILAPLIIFGAMKMVNGEKLGLARTSAILAMLPLSSCCFVIGIPLGIWALVVMRKPEVKAVFENQNPNQFYPPQPPQW